MTLKRVELKDTGLTEDGEYVFALIMRYDNHVWYGRVRASYNKPHELARWFSRQYAVPTAVRLVQRKLKTWLGPRLSWITWLPTAEPEIGVKPENKG